jgi:plasmid stabilization system protein ParE
VRIIWHSLALAEYNAILEQALSRDPKEIGNIQRNVDRVLANLLVFPKTGRLHRNFQCLQKVVPQTSIIFVYLIKDEDIIILSTFHTSRDPHSKPFERKDDML